MSKKRKKGGKRRKDNTSRNSTLMSAVRKYFKQNPKRKYSDKQVTKAFSSMASKKEVEEVLIKLYNTDFLLIGAGGKYQLNKTSESRSIEGIVDMTKSGNAYIVVEGMNKDIFVHARNNKAKAFDGDKVIVQKIPSNRRNRIEGTIVEVIERKRDTFICTFKLNDHFAFAVPVNEHIPVDFYIHKSKFEGAEDNDMVVVKMLDWPSTSKNPFGKVIEVLGSAQSSDIEMRSILVEHGFDLSFSEETMKFLKEIPAEISKSEIKRRRDFRSVTTFTIDPVDAKDFDDALSIQRLENGNWEIGIHIADVTHYVEEGSVLDNDAYKRATSVYLVDRVMPMLPERLSNELCSLRPNEESLCFSAVFELDEDAAIQSEWFGRTVIYSDFRFAYEEAQLVLDGEKHKYDNLLVALNKIAKKLNKKRFKNGSINFETKEVRFDLDDEGKPIGIKVKERKDAHKLVEEFMLLANKRVAHFVGKEKNKAGKNNFVYRIHDLPDLDKLEDLRLFASKFGYHLQFNNPNQISSSLNKFMKEIEGKPEQDLLQSLAIRTMAKAIYTTENIGHYGLGFDFYTHFTSPIRRYPDVLVHRVLQAVLDGKSTPKESFLEAKCKHSSERERAAMEAERESVKYKMAEFMQDKIGQQFSGVISGVKEWGIYVEIPEWNCEGMVRSSDLVDDIYFYNEKQMHYKGMNSNKIYQLGDNVEVIILAVDLAKRTIDMEIYNE